MNRSRFSEKEMKFIVSQAEKGAKISDICHIMNISPATFYNWKSKYTSGNNASYKKNLEGTLEIEKLKDKIQQLENDKKVLLSLLSSSNKG